jgi:RNA polymerase sigma-70 factor (ECF subfamily)
MDDEGRLAASGTDPSQFAAVYVRCGGQVAGYFHRRIPCPHTVAELTAETFARAFEGRSRFEPDRGTATAWLLGIAANVYRQWCRSGAVGDRARRRLEAGVGPGATDDLEAVEWAIDHEGDRRALDPALDGLSARVRDAVVLRVGLGLPYADLAVHLGCSVGAARVRVARGLATLRAREGWHDPR